MVQQLQYTETLLVSLCVLGPLSDLGGVRVCLMFFVLGMPCTLGMLVAATRVMPTTRVLKYDESDLRPTTPSTGTENKMDFGIAVEG